MPATKDPEPCSQGADDSLMILWARLTEIARQHTHDMRVTDDDWGNYRAVTNEGRPFVCVRLLKRHVSVFSLPMAHHPDILPHILAPRRKGRVTLRFTSDEDPLIEHLPRFLQACRTLIGRY